MPAAARAAASLRSRGATIAPRGVPASQQGRAPSPPRTWRWRGRPHRRSRARARQTGPAQVDAPSHGVGGRHLHYPTASRRLQLLLGRPRVRRALHVLDGHDRGCCRDRSNAVANHEPGGRAARGKAVRRSSSRQPQGRGQYRGRQRCSRLSGRGTPDRAQNRASCCGHTAPRRLLGGTAGHRVAVRVTQPRPAPPRTAAAAAQPGGWPRRWTLPTIPS